MSESAAPETTKPRKKKKKRRKKAVGRARKGSSSTKKVVRKKRATKKATTKKATTKKRATKKTASGTRGGRRAPQGRRLGGWEMVKRDDVFKHLKKTGTTIATLARTLGVGSSAVHAWKAGRRYPSEQAQLKLRQILKGDLAPVATKAKKSARTRAFSGKAFRKLREERGLSRAKLSKQLGVSAGSIRNWEAGVSKPRGGNLAKVQDFLAATPSAPSAPSAPLSAAGEGGVTPSGGDAAVLGAAQVASAYLAAGNSITAGEVVSFVASLRRALS